VVTLPHVGVNVELQDERGATLKVVFDSESVLARPLPGGDTSYPCLRSIDRYGDTMFNRLQVPLLIEEINRLRNGAADNLLEILDEVERLAQHSLAEPHLYLKFVGD
jgi:hypothetical protein